MNLSKGCMLVNAFLLSQFNHDLLVWKCQSFIKNSKKNLGPKIWEMLLLDFDRYKIFCKE